MKDKTLSKKDGHMKIVIPIVVVAITVSVLIYPEHGLKALPLYFSIGIMALNANANRLGFLFGGLNSVLYGLVYLNLRLYSSAINAFLVSAPIQLITFALWSRNKYKHTTVFKKLSKMKMLIVAVFTVVAWVAQYFLLKNSNAQFLLLDNTAMVLSTICSILSLLSYKEYAYFNLLGLTCTLTMYFLMLPATPSIITYIIFQLYAFFCVCKMTAAVEKAYKEQQKPIAEESITIEHT